MLPSPSPTRATQTPHNPISIITTIDEEDEPPTTVDGSKVQTQNHTPYAGEPVVGINERPSEAPAALEAEAPHPAMDSGATDHNLEEGGHDQAFGDDDEFLGIDDGGEFQGIDEEGEFMGIDGGSAPEEMMQAAADEDESMEEFDMNVSVDDSDDDADKPMKEPDVGIDGDGGEDVDNNRDQGLDGPRLPSNSEERAEEEVFADDEDDEFIRSVSTALHHEAFCSFLYCFFLSAMSGLTLLP